MTPSLKSRLLTSVIGIPIIILILLAPKSVITFVVMLVSLIGMYEYYKTTGLSEHKNLCVMGYIAAIVISVGLKLSVASSLTLVYLYVVALFLLMLFSNRTISIKHLGELLFGLVYIPYFLSHIIYIHSLDFGRFYVWLVFIGAFMSDSCAYFAGSYLGKHKLCPDISPKKTVEGAIGGVIGSGVSFVIYGIIVNTFFTSYLNGGSFNLILLFVLGIIASIVSQIGDLTASAIKRQFGIKDFGNIFPGHGGMLDRCDSIILVAPIIFLFLYSISIII